MDIIKKETNSNGDIFYGYYDNDNVFRYHREDGPAIITKDGAKEWWVHDKLHREDGPAEIGADGRELWWVDFERHRLGGPAMTDIDGNKTWWANGNNVSKEVEYWLDERNLDPDNLSEEDQLALSFYMRSL